MKQFKNYIYIILIVPFVFGACEKDLLDQQNPNYLRTETFWKNENDLLKGLNATYSALQFKTMWGMQRCQLWQRSDESYYTYSWGGDHTAFGTFTYNNNQGVIPELWADIYIGIFRANQVIKYADELVDEDLAELDRRRIIGQARFLRAFFYNELATLFGQGIIRDIDYDSDLIEKAPVSKEDLFEKMIKPDLYYAIDNLPDTWTEDNMGRATSGSAKTLLGKAYLWEENWDSAAVLFQQVINSGVYSLTPDPLENFVAAGEFNSESIFEISFNAEEKPNISGAIQDDYPEFNVYGSEANNISLAFNGYEAGGYNRVQPTYWLEELFTTQDLDPSDDRNGVFSRRAYGSIVNQSMEGPYFGAEDPADYAAFRFGWSAKVKKFVPWNTKNSPMDQNIPRVGINYKVMRLADVYLMYAEAVLNRDGDVGVATAVEYIDYVRDRAGVVTLDEYMNANGGQFPRLDQSFYYNNGTRNFTNANATSVMRHIRMVERPLELCFEGHRWRDMVRWGIVDDIFEERYREELFMVNTMCTEDPASRSIDKDKNDLIAPWFLEETVRTQFEQAVENYSSTQHDFLPMPDVEVQSNQNATN